MSIANPAAAIALARTMPLSWWAGWAGFITGATGALMLAVNLPWSGWGWLAFLASNIAWITHSLLSGPRSLLLQQLVFIVTTFVGITRWLT